MPRIVLFGATGYTGRLTLRCLVDAGCRPVLCGRSAGRLERLAADHGGLETHAADASDPASLVRILEPEDVLITTVGPFGQFGDGALEACLESGATYIDSTGEPPFLHDVFQRWGPRAVNRCALLPACGFDYVPGNLAGALALRQAGNAAETVEVVYVLRGAGSGGWASGGTLASAVGTAFRPWFRFSGGRLTEDRPAARRRSFRIGGRVETAISIGGSEHFALPTLAPGLQGVDVFLAVGPFALALQAGSLWAQGAALFPGVEPAASWMASTINSQGGRGPSDGQRASSGFLVVAHALGRNRERLADIELAGPNGYDFTARFLTWAALRAVENGVHGTGALGPVQAFGLDEVLTGCVEAGMSGTLL